MCRDKYISWAIRLMHLSTSIRSTCGETLIEQFSLYIFFCIGGRVVAYVTAVGTWSFGYDSQVGPNDCVLQLFVSDFAYIIVFNVEYIFNKKRIIVFYQSIWLLYYKSEARWSFVVVFS